MSANDRVFSIWISYIKKEFPKLYNCKYDHSSKKNGQIV